jgi:Thioesterase-like superfamily
MGHTTDERQASRGLRRSGAIEPQDRHVFDADTSVERVADHTFAASLTDRWSTLRGPSGGYGLATSLQALATEMPFPDAVTTAAFFHSAATPGPAEIRTETLRRGRSMATGQARLIQGEREILRVLATFADLELAQGRTLELGMPPRVLDLDTSVDLDPGGAFPGSTLTERFHYRVAEAHGWRLGRPSGDATLEFALAFSQPRRIDSLALALIVDVCPRAVYELGEYSPITLELTVHVRARPAPGPLVGRVMTRHVRDGYHEEDLELWDSERRLVAQSRQLALLPKRDCLEDAR